MTEVQIVDDHKMVVESLERMIAESGVARVTGRYYDIASCREGLKQGVPDILLLDVALPDGDGIEFCAEAVRLYPSLKIIMLTSYKEFNIARHALHNGARGYILKNADLEEVFAGIETVDRGELFLCEEIDLLLSDKRDTAVIWLTNREKEILRYTAEGYTVKEIADLIFRAPETVKLYRKQLLLKLQVKNMAELIRKGYDMKLI